MRRLNHPNTPDIQLDAVLAALSDPVRRLIACRLSHCEDNQACLTFELPVSKSTASHHFRVLREAGVIRQEYEGTSIMNSLRAGDLEQRFPGLLRAVFDAQNAADAASEPHSASTPAR